jgi:DNA primase
MDADSAGIEATLRALQEAASTGAIRARSASVHPAEIGDEEFSSRTIEWTRDSLKRASVNFFVIPLLGKDPDEMIRADRTAWDSAVASAKPFTDHIFDTVAGRKDLTQPKERSELLGELLPVVRLIDEPVFRAHYEQRLAHLAQVDEAVVRTELQKPPARPNRKTQAPQPLPASASRREPAEEFLLALLLRHPDLRATGEGIPQDVFLLSEHRAIYRVWLDTSDVESIRGALTEDLTPHLERVLARELPVLEGPKLRDALEDCVRRIEWRRLSAAKRASTAALTEPTVQQYMSAAVKEAIALQADNPTDLTDEESASASDAKTLELATSLVEDQEMGRRLHETAAGAGSTQQPDLSPEQGD